MSITLPSPPREVRLAGDRPDSDVLSRIGDTPLFELKSLSAQVAPVRIFGKAEWYNPGGSVKDRPALNMILRGIEDGVLTREKRILDATSGNTGIAYAMVGAALGYGVTLAVPRNLGQLHRRILEAYGAELVFTDPHKGSDGAIEKAMTMHDAEPGRWFYPNQYGNDANWQAHYQTTAPEIFRQTEGAVTHFVAGLGTSGTFVGTGRGLRVLKPDVRLVRFEPDSPMHGLEGMKHYPTSIVPSIFDPDLADETRSVSTEDAQAMVRHLARHDGILIGPSAGANLWCALQVARELKEGVVVTILCDSAHKYLDHEFWKEEA